MVLRPRWRGHGGAGVMRRVGGLNLGAEKRPAGVRRPRPRAIRSHVVSGRISTRRGLCTVAATPRLATASDRRCAGKRIAGGPAPRPRAIRSHVVSGRISTCRGLCTVAATPRLADDGVGPPVRRKTARQRTARRPRPRAITSHVKPLHGRSAAAAGDGVGWREEGMPIGSIAAACDGLGRRKEASPDVGARPFVDG